MGSIAEAVAAAAARRPSRETQARIDASNASLPAFSGPLNGPEPRWSNERLNAAGYTLLDGPMKGQVVIASSDTLPPENTLAHEGFHARRLQAEAPPNATGYSTGALGDHHRWQLADRMAKEQPPADRAGPYWGLQPNRSQEELIANLVGYEGGLPKGTTILDTEVGRRLLPTQRDVDYYFTQSSVPYGGVWEGQAPKQSVTSSILDAIRRAWIGGGFNTVNR